MQTSLWENNIAEYENGKLVMLMRAEFTGYLYRSFSDDYGKTWSKPEKTGKNRYSKSSIKNHLAEIRK